MELLAKTYHLFIILFLLVYFFYKARYLIIYIFSFNKRRGEIIDIIKFKSASEIYFDYKIKSEENKIFITKNHFPIPELRIGDKFVFINANEHAIIISLGIYQFVFSIILLFVFIVSIVIQLFNVIYHQPINNTLQFILTIVGVSILIAHYFINRYKQRKHLFLNGVKADGRIINIESKSDTDGESVYSPVIEFTNHHGTTIKFTSMSKVYNRKNIIVGKNVNIYYDKYFNEFAETEDHLKTLV
jgi:hypothetical protein